jgi:putative restriction endonuclease
MSAEKGHFRDTKRRRISYQLPKRESPNKMSKTAVGNPTAKLGELTVWTRGGKRAPHKPLLVLLALARLKCGLHDLPYTECEPILTSLLREFGAPSSTLHPEYPFWRLQNDGVWVVDSQRRMSSRASNTDPPRTELRAAKAIGRFSPEVQRELLAEPQLIDATARRLLNENFPSSLHDAILSAIGMDLTGDEVATRTRRQRDPEFRRSVLQAYGYRCAICSVDLRLGNLSIGLEAAHIRWHQAFGPDVVSNGLALCALHHKLFDFGAISLDDKLKLIVSEQANGSVGLEELLLRHHGNQLRRAVQREDAPRLEFVRWHRMEVFKPRARPQ